MPRNKGSPPRGISVSPLPWTAMVDLAVETQGTEFEASDRCHRVDRDGIDLKQQPRETTTAK
jgi:hypothetical protein